MGSDWLSYAAITDQESLYTSLKTYIYSLCLGPIAFI